MTATENLPSVYQTDKDDRNRANSSQLYRDGKRVLECLQRALRVADTCMETATSIELFVEILDRYVYYFDQQNESVRLIAEQDGNAPDVPKLSPSKGLIYFSGDDKISKRAYRANPLEFGWQSARFWIN